MSGKRAKLAALLKSGSYTTTLSALTTSKLVVTWSWVPKSKKTRSTVLATARVTIKKAGKVKIRIRLTKDFKMVLGKAKSLKVGIKATFTPTGREAITATKTVTFER